MSVRSLSASLVTMVFACLGGGGESAAWMWPHGGHEAATYTDSRSLVRFQFQAWLPEVPDGYFAKPCVPLACVAWGSYLVSKELPKPSQAWKSWIRDPGIPVDAQIFQWLPRWVSPASQLPGIFIASRVFGSSCRIPSASVAAQMGFPSLPVTR